MVSTMRPMPFFEWPEAEVGFPVLAEYSSLTVRFSLPTYAETMGQSTFFVFTIEDVSAGKQADKELREEERFRTSLLHSPLPILLCDDREHSLVVSQSWLEQSGYLRQELQRVEVDDWSPWRCSDVVLDNSARP
jgi:PAS domain-containing protein